MCKNTELCHGITKGKYTNANIIPAYMSSDVEVFLFQVATAMFALRSPYAEGAILADEGGLGKTYEALLIISQLWFEGKEHMLIVVPIPLLMQWADILEHHF
ncbi:hypothetical protein AGMMS49975_21450 [Clostridia bacterium]|nr:hypothetical protein AGMMS49975_21450 [Clostridia bacterium]